MNWATNFAVSVDPAHGKAWAELMTPRSVGLILKSIKSDYKFVRSDILFLSPATVNLPSETGTHTHQQPG